MGSLRSLGIPSAILLQGIGMVRETELAYWNGQEYVTHAHPDPRELVSLQGNLGIDRNQSPVVHAHVCLADEQGAVAGGHLVNATVHNTLEMALLPLEGVVLDRIPEPNGLVGLFPRAS